jgi:hypothetical protein
LEIVVIAIVAVLAGADRWQDVERFGRAKEAWFRLFLPLTHGIPSREAFERVFAVLDPQAFEACFRTVGGVALRADSRGDHRGGRQDAAALYDPNAVPAALHLVSAWATANRVVPARLATEAKSDQNMAIPRLLGLLHLEGGHVTVETDAPCSAGAVRGLWGDREHAASDARHELSRGRVQSETAHRPREPRRIASQCPAARQAGRRQIQPAQ